MADALYPPRAPVRAAPDDFEEHRRTYDAVLHVVAIGTIHVLSVVVGLAIGGVGHHWGLAGFWIVVATLAVPLGAASPRLAWRPGLVVLVVMLATLAMTTQP